MELFYISQRKSPMNANVFSLLILLLLVPGESLQQSTIFPMLPIGSPPIVRFDDILTDTTKCSNASTPLASDTGLKNCYMQPPINIGNISHVFADNSSTGLVLFKDETNLMTYEANQESSKLAIVFWVFSIIGICMLIGAASFLIYLWFTLAYALFDSSIDDLLDIGSDLFS
jgi:hypothetical protein